MLAKSAVFFLFLGFSFSVLAEEIVDSNTLIKRDGLYFKKNFSKPFTGRVIGTFRGKMIDGKREGLWFGFGQLQWQANYVDGKKNGLYKSFHANGKLNVRALYFEDKMNGLYESYYNSGILRRKVNFIENKENGILESYYENGFLKMKAHYKDGLQNGIEEWYSKDRTLYLQFLCTKGICEKIHEKVTL